MRLHLVSAASKFPQICYTNNMANSSYYSGYLCGVFSSDEVTLWLKGSFAPNHQIKSPKNKATAAAHSTRCDIWFGVTTPGQSLARWSVCGQYLTRRDTSKVQHAPRAITNRCSARPASWRTQQLRMTAFSLSRLCAGAPASDIMLILQSENVSSFVFSPSPRPSSSSAPLCRWNVCICSVAETSPWCPCPCPCRARRPPVISSVHRVKRAMTYLSLSFSLHSLFRMYLTPSITAVLVPPPCPPAISLYVMQEDNSCTPTRSRPELICIWYTLQLVEV